MARVLVLDDELRIRSLVRRVLEHVGHEVVEAPSGVDALATLQEGDFDLLVTDLHMPEMLGTEVVERVRESHPTLPIVLMSGRSGLDLEDAGVASLLPKPFGVPELSAAVELALL